MGIRQLLQAEGRENVGGIAQPSVTGPPVVGIIPRLGYPTYVLTTLGL